MRKARQLEFDFEQQPADDTTWTTAESLAVVSIVCWFGLIIITAVIILWR